MKATQGTVKNLEIDNKDNIDNSAEINKELKGFLEKLFKET